MRDEECVLRVERGQAEPDELAAIAAVLIARSRALRSRAETAAARRPRVRRSAPAYSAPGSWR
ncbi:acyl-CoA carboxylase epsilon subunit [Streptomyces sp. KL116D]|uniref:acyl-CoA carboxylase epsilon subunit n=1 Tax=Streptomyces sp. KL116D TaxID=3045152 RepID=UPI0035593278